MHVAIAAGVFDALGCAKGLNASTKKILEKAGLKSGLGQAKADSVLEAICFMDDKSVLGLAKSARVDVARILADPVPECWSPLRFRLFLSHVSTHQKDATNLALALERFGIQSFVAHNDIKPTRAWRDQIELALRTCDALLALMTPKFHESEWTDQEIGFVMGTDRLAVAVNLGLEAYGFIADLQSFKGGGKAPYDLAKEICRALVGNDKTTDRIAEALVAELRKSKSYAGTAEIMEMIEFLPKKHPGLATRLKAAKIMNDQVRGEWHAPATIDRLYLEWTT